MYSHWLLAHCSVCTETYKRTAVMQRPQLLLSQQLLENILNIHDNKVLCHVDLYSALYMNIILV